MRQMDVAEVYGVCESLAKRNREVYYNYIY